MSPTLDVITLRGLSVQGIHGVLPQEHHAPQLFVVDIAVWADISDAVDADDISHTVSYADVARIASEIIRGESVRLIETLADRIAEAIMEMPRAVGAEVTVHKPQAPIDEDFVDVSVTLVRGHVPYSALTGRVSDGTSDGISAGAEAIEVRDEVGGEVRDQVGSTEESEESDTGKQTTHRRAVIALGGNVGDVPVTLRSVVEAFIDNPQTDVVDVSPLLRTRAVTLPNTPAQDDHWNAVVLLDTVLEPSELLEYTRALENIFGRLRTEKWGPRTVDIDLIDIAGVELDTDVLTLPHPRAYQRAFVLAPWLLIDPEAALPGHGFIAELFSEAEDRDGIVDAIEDWLENPQAVIGDSNAYLASLADTTPHVDQAPELVPVELSTPHTTFLSRLDLVPEASRTGLAPSDADDDIVWRSLWDKWAKPMLTVPEGKPLAHELPVTATVPTSTPNPVSEPALALLDDSAPAQKTVMEEGHDAQAFEEDQHVGAEIDGMGEVNDLDNKVAHVSWFPVRDGVNPIALPSWEFSDHLVRVIDDEEPEPVTSSIVKPDLGEGIELGPLEEQDVETTLDRRITVLPTATGAISIIRPQERAE